MSENRSVYRAEYLAYKILQAGRNGGIDFGSFLGLPEDEQTKLVQQFMAPRYAEGYVKGVHDHDALLILQQLIKLDSNLQLLKYPADARALANLYGALPAVDDFRKSLGLQANALAAARDIFDDNIAKDDYVSQLVQRIQDLASQLDVFDNNLVDSAAQYYFEQLTTTGKHVCSSHADQLCVAFTKFVERKQKQSLFESTIKNKQVPFLDRFLLVRNWIVSFSDMNESGFEPAYFNEAAYFVAD